MRIVLRIVGALIALAVVALGLSMIASEKGGEVVVLRTQAEDGSPRETRIWVVDENGRQWVRAGSPASRWLVDIQRNGAVEVTRADATAPYTAVPDAASRDRLNALFAEKYGLADAYIGLLFGRDDATPIRLDPR